MHEYTLEFQAYVFPESVEMFSFWMFRGSQAKKKVIAEGCQALIFLIPNETFC